MSAKLKRASTAACAHRICPFTITRGGTALDVTRLVYQDTADRLEFARLWGGGAFSAEAKMLFDFSEPERNTARRALEIYVSDLREEIVKTERHEWRQALHQEKELLEGVIEQLSI
jgi:hypothetical protein